MKTMLNARAGRRGVGAALFLLGLLALPALAIGQGSGTSPYEPGPSDPTCANQIQGTHGEDELFGTSGGDYIHGRRSADRIKGRPGVDCLKGGLGADRVAAGPGDDELIKGGGGRDRIQAHDGQPEEINCGVGKRDVAVVDQGDSTDRCEKVRIR